MNPSTVAVPAEDAPIGVLLWDVVRDDAAPNFTLEAVTTTQERTATGVRSWVTWTYQSGAERTFPPGAAVACRLPGRVTR
jgi:hypothetical protein